MGGNTKSNCAMRDGAILGGAMGGVGVNVAIAGAAKVAAGT